jgi:parvulin-like peptidyl-prolyl isomerase
MRRKGLPPAHASAFDLKPGQVSPVITDATGHYIYKLDWKRVESLDAVRTEISNALRGERLRKMVQSLEEPFTTEINDAYFGADSANNSD